MTTSHHVTRRSVLAGLAGIPIAVATAQQAAAREPGAARSWTHRTIFVAGDSTAAPKGAARAPETGWGMALPFYLADRIAVANHARNGRSSKNFVDEGRLDTILAELRAGDVLLVQFGHNDQKTDDPVRHTEPWSTYQEYLTRYLDGARERGAVPVLATSAERRRFDAAGNATSSHGEYPDAMRALAVREGVALVDVQRESLALWQELGPDETTRYFLHTDDGRVDNTHFNTPGAAAVALMVARGLVGSGVLQRGDVRRLGEVPDPSWFTWLPRDPA
ncbi:rhamnogalacturonan acetylesterase [Isoptericola croceus]|uniref:rhamnogalacturonan acetylesterase n=1 Tax=Isoptericola croceus TaxID=3031406 RepID=UPI0023F6727B|nr:rhamnogalacturonan acetylesterase [Isoptericola croceus]